MLSKEARNLAATIVEYGVHVPDVLQQYGWTKTQYTDLVTSQEFLDELRRARLALKILPNLKNLDSARVDAALMGNGAADRKAIFDGFGLEKQSPLVNVNVAGERFLDQVTAFLKAGDGEQFALGGNRATDLCLSGGEESARGDGGTTGAELAVGSGEVGTQHHTPEAADGAVEIPSEAAPEAVVLPPCARDDETVHRRQPDREDDGDLGGRGELGARVLPVERAACVSPEIEAGDTNSSPDPYWLR